MRGDIRFGGARHWGVWLFGVMCGFAFGALAAFAVAAAGPAVAVPGDPMAGCETQVFANYCDGPIRDDGSWRRCLFAHAQPTYGGGFVPPVQNCFIVPGEGQIPALPLGQPPYHIG